MSDGTLWPGSAGDALTSFEIKSTRTVMNIEDIYGKPFYYLSCKIVILYVIADILYRI